MIYGYSARLIDLNKKADARLLGVRLGRVCMKNNVPVSQVATKLGVSRQTIYNWFCGTHSPKPTVGRQVLAYYTTITASK
jgi:transcriptional regulator with XRE-family HTH domain